MDDYEIKEAFKNQPDGEIMPDETVKCSLYDNGMELKEVYDGRTFPQYRYRSWFGRIVHSCGCVGDKPHTSETAQKARTT